ncbi:undecaprenyl-phosphate glucose phosphotransferase [Halomonas sp. RA08-2]|uniref:undecaprenyl-phosphate glucose phosphotransferase n=1 Tax=Halomonas sp. RA08-2 TaxID=3440842 RepID=UPI003EEEB721
MDRSSAGISERYPAQLIVPVVDIFAIVAGAMLAYWFRFETFDMHERFWLATTIMGLLVVLLNLMQGAYARWRITRIPTLLAKLCLVWATVAIIAASLIFFAHAAERFSRLWVGGALLISFGISASARVAAQIVLRRARRFGRARRSVFLVGPPELLLQLGKGMRNAPAEGYSIAGVQRVSGEMNVAELDQLARRVVDSGAREVWICVPLEMGGIVRSIFYVLRHHTLDVRFIPDFRGMQLLNHRMSEVAGHLAVDLSVTPLDGLARIIKRMEDLILGALITLLIIPVCLAIAIAIKVTSPGPVLFKQYRTGSNGRRFKVYKFRSMVLHEERNGQVTQARRGDPRVTRVGAFLRRTSLDELPQFYNVLQGRMSIVGPRPHALAHNEYYMDIVESYMKRHKVKPGITGWAQINGHRGETDTVEKMENRVACDLWYIDNWSLWLDLRIILTTVYKGFFSKSAY